MFARVTMQRMWLAAMVVAGMTGVAHAAGDTMRVDYDAPADCPDAAAFRAQVRARTNRADLVTEGDTPRSLRIQIVSNNGRAVGRLQVRDADGATSTREVSGERCADVVVALALTAALAIDLHARAKPAPLPLPPAPLAPARVAAPPPSPSPISVGMGIDSLLGGGIGTRVALGGMLSVDGSLETSAVFAPWVRLSIAHARTDVAFSDPHAAFAWTVGALAFAPVRVPSDGILGLRPYFISHAGVLRAWGIDVLNARSSTLGWFDAGIGAHLELALSRHVGLDIDGSAAIPITRVEFVLDAPTAQVYTAPWIAWTASAGAHFGF
jgi:hypothetical protein